MPTQITEPMPGGCNIGCHDCAFRAGSDTRREPYNVMNSMFCELGGKAFFCHYDKAGHDFHTDSVKPEMNQLVVCQGWKQAMAERAADPVWRRNRKFLRAAAELGSGALELLTRRSTKRERAQHMATIKRSIKLIAKLLAGKRMRIVRNSRTA